MRTTETEDAISEGDPLAEGDHEGTQVFNATMEEKISKMQLQQMENRLKKLQEEDHRAQALIEQNKKRCRDLDHMRRKKQEDRSEKEAWRDWQHQELEKKRAQVNYERAKLREGIRKKREREA